MLQVQRYSPIVGATGLDGRWIRKASEIF